MRRYVSFEVDDCNLFKQKVLFYLRNYEVATIYDSSDYNISKHTNNKTTHSAYDFIAGFDAVQLLSGGLEQVKKAFALGDWMLGYLSYDLKNELEHLYSVNNDNLQFENTSFFQPRYLLICKQGQWQFSFLDTLNTEDELLNILMQIKSTAVESINLSPLTIKQRVTKANYIKDIDAILEHIHKGDIYELNYCMEFFADNVSVDAFNIYKVLSDISPTPFASFFKIKDKYILCASPERYICKRDNKVITQPIKGTSKRGLNAEEDLRSKQMLMDSQKEQSENIMIVDLVRNDLSKIAKKGSVNVDELCGIYGFKQVYQMISTVSATLDEEADAFDVITATFPMGSMTGAPKLRATKLIEKYELTKRGVYSGSIGYITPEKDFDFNVVIRSILYNETLKYLSFMVGGAITAKSIPEDEYNECKLKALAIFKVLTHN